MATVNPFTAAAISKAAAKPKEPDMVEVTQFMDQQGKKYFAKSPKTEHCVKYPAVVKLVVKGGPEDK